MLIVKKNTDPNSKSIPGKCLSSRELQVAELCARGMTNKEIGRLIGISPLTVKKHKERIFKKLDMHKARDLVAVFG